MQNQKSAIGLDGNITALIGYIISIIALVEIFIEKDNRFVRFHAIQSVIFHVAMWVFFFVVWIVVFILGMIMSMVHLGGVVWLLSILIFLAWIVVYLGGVILGAVKSYGGAMFKYPMIGNMAEKWT
ncbi:MAG TPA: DUF4870 domain-containing protein [Pyrinomonadaceae bacterium]|nr:DUF4870 domain-containing protein [Pyrinomonadaceae bacterium]